MEHAKGKCECRIEYCGKAAGIIPCPLCAAAPKLLEACEALVAAPEMPPDDQFDIEQRRYRNCCLDKIDAAKKLGKAAIAAATK